MTNELYVRGRPVERFRENIKIKRFYNIPAEKGIQKKTKQTMRISGIIQVAVCTSNWTHLSNKTEQRHQRLSI